MKKLQLILGFTTSLACTAATAYIEPLDLTRHDFSTPAKPHVIDIQCEAPDSAQVTKCLATYSDTSTRHWWLKLQPDGKMYRYPKYPTTGVKPVPFGQ